MVRPSEFDGRTFVASVFYFFTPKGKRICQKIQTIQ